eukprot:CAMPEP_0179177326 /NCGR_PEP_ID=MMETSP0796-20121207/87692_1 /TAXON_ID=73915 /ORGANISM="Pyrodinium bahamense, Strain pbaha01" /LENGTH=179 /DNA_ID=CAMNT_0020880873 /DNA_START=173 /DNA_END=714 /DNA_ORIENTATION=+
MCPQRRLVGNTAWCSSQAQRSKPIQCRQGGRRIPAGRGIGRLLQPGEEAVQADLAASGFRFILGVAADASAELPIEDTTWLNRFQELLHDNSSCFSLHACLAVLAWPSAAFLPSGSTTQFKITSHRSQYSHTERHVEWGCGGLLFNGTCTYLLKALYLLDHRPALARRELQLPGYRTER